MQLYINSRGTYVHVKDEIFEIWIRKPKEDPVKKHFSPLKITSFILTYGSAISSDAVILALKHNIDILYTDSSGMPLGRVWHGKPGSTAKIRKNQLLASVGEKGLEVSKKWISRKINNQVEYLKDLKKHRQPLYDWFDERIKRLKEIDQSVLSVTGKSANEAAPTLRGYEGTAGRIYFDTLSNILPEKHKFEGRSSRPAKDSFNAFLNYAYGILYGRVEKCLVIAGLDPYTGFFHRDDYNMTSFVYDFIEPYRIIAERVVFGLFTAKKVKNDHIEPVANGYKLNQSGKELLIPAFTKYFEEQKVRYRGRSLSRFHGMQLDAHEFAQFLIKDKELKDNQLNEIMEL
jgi:CRISPR-associated protein Cas1